VDGENAAELACLPGVSLELSRLFLERLAARDPDAEHVVIWDQAGFHPQPGLHELPARVHVLPLPPYSPELNPVEVIGDGISFQQSNDVQVKGCVVERCAGFGLHPGSGSQQPSVKNCHAVGNDGDGFFFCWRVRGGVAEGNWLENNGGYGMSIGHKDSDNFVR
jgi:hypothetical protein